MSQGKIVDIDLLGANVENVDDWLSIKGLDEMQSFLCLDQLNNIKTPWVLLDSHVSQKNESNGRRMFCFVRSLLVSNNDLPDLVDSLSKQHLGGRWLPEIPDVYYTFAGEIPWGDMYLENGIEELRFETGEKLVKEKRSQEILYLDGEKLTLSRFDLMIQSSVGEKELNDEEIDRIVVKVEEIEEIVNKKTYIKYDSVIPVKDFSWESHHSIVNDAGSAMVLTKEIALSLDLIAKPQSFEFFTHDGQQVTYNISDNSDGFENSQRLFYMREDTLKQFLEKNNLSLVWAVWGERQHFDHQYEVFSDVKLHEM